MQARAYILSKSHILVIATCPGSSASHVISMRELPLCFLIVAVRHSPEAHGNTAMQPKDLLAQGLPDDTEGLHARASLARVNQVRC
jgi:hypothetical protein